MKEKKELTSAQTQISNKEKNALFTSILNMEASAHIDAEIHKYVTRVGMVLKVLHNRGLTTTLLSFQDKLTELVQLTCATIDNELSNAKED